MSDISHDFSDKRKYYRLSIPVRVTIENQVYKTLDWSVCAIKVGDYAGFLGVNDEIEAAFELNFQGFTVKFTQKIKVLRVDQKSRTLVAEFIEISPRNKEILTYFSKKLITGEFQSFDDVIKHIDIPVNDDYIDKTFQAEPCCDPPLPKRILVYTSYIILGLLVIAYIFHLFYSRAYLMQVESAVVAAKKQTINSPVRGILEAVYAREGESVAESEPLFKVANSNIQKEIEAKKLELFKNQALLNQKKTMLKNTLYEGKIGFLTDELEKKKILYKNQLVTKPEIDRLKSEILELEHELVIVHSEIERLAKVIELNEKDLAFSEAVLDNNTVKAPFSGVLDEVIAYNGKFVDEKTPVIVLKPDSDNKYIEAYLKEKQPHKLVMNSRVYIDIPIYGVSLEGVLSQIKRENDSIKAFIEPDESNLLEEVKIGTPVKISFTKNHFFAAQKKQTIIQKRLPQILKMPPAPVKTLKSQGIEDKTQPEAARTQRAFKDSYNTAFLGLCYERENNEKCLSEAKTRLLAWAKTNEPEGNPINETQLEGFIYGYNLIKSALSPEDQDVIINWLIKIRDKQLNWKFGPTSGLNNWRTHSLKMVLLIDNALEDDKAFNEHLQLAKEHFRANINSDTGESYDYKQKGNSLWYHTYNLEAWLEIAFLSDEIKSVIKPQFEFLKNKIQAGESTKITRAVYVYYGLFPEEKDTTLINIANKNTSIKHDFFKLRANLDD